MDFVNKYSDKEKKKNGVFYTPKDIAEFMASKSKFDPSLNVTS